MKISFALFALTSAATKPTDCVVKLYKNCFYDGYVGTYGHGQQYEHLGEDKVRNDVVNEASELAYAFNDDISSVEIEGNCAIFMYDKVGFKGDSRVLTKSTPCLVDTDIKENQEEKGRTGEHINDFNDKISSFKVASLYFDNEETAADEGNKWVSNDDYDKKMVVVKNTKYVSSTAETNEDGTPKIMTFTEDSYPEGLDHRATYALQYAQGGIGNREEVGKTVDCNKQFNGKSICSGANLFFTYNGMSARLVTPFETAHDAALATSKDLEVYIQDRQGNDVPAVLNGNQLDWKLDGRRNIRNRDAGDEKDAQDDCHVVVYEECQNFSNQERTGVYHDFFPGHYKKAQQDGSSITVKAIEIKGECKVRVYDLASFGGEEKVFTVSQECMNATPVQEFESRVLSASIKDGEYKKNSWHAQDAQKYNHASRGDAHTHSTESGSSTHLDNNMVSLHDVHQQPKQSLRVASLETVHYNYPTSYPTRYPTPSPTFSLDMPECPLKCVYHDFKNTGHKLNVIHQKSFIKQWSTFRATYPNVLQGEAQCWHELPGGVDEIKDSTDPAFMRNHQDFNHADSPVINPGGCHCRCS